MDFDQIAKWEDQMARTKGLPEVPETQQKDIQVPLVVRKCRKISKAQMARKCAGACAQPLDGKKKDVVECIAKEVASVSRGRNIVVMDGTYKVADSSWEQNPSSCEH